MTAGGAVRALIGRGRRRRSAARAACERWLGPVNVLLAWIVLPLIVLHPPHGTDLRICWFAGTTGSPCPGCGLTRSMSCAVRGMLAESVAYHPFGPVVVLLLASAAAVSLLPARRRRGVAAWCVRHAVLVDRAFVAFAASFVAWSVARTALHLAGLTG